MRGSRPGIALLNVMMLAMVTTIFLVTAVQFVSGSLKQSRQGRNDSLIYNVAAAGLNDSLSWLRKQTKEPVETFDIVEDTTNTAVETEDEQIGLVHEWELDPTRNLWARYEVGRSANAPARGSVVSQAVWPSSYNKAWWPTSTTATAPYWFAEDVSLARGRTTAGQIWRVRSRGYLYTRSATVTSFSPTVRPLQALTVEAELAMPSFQARDAALYNFNDGDADLTALTGITACSISGLQIKVHSHNAASEAVLGVKDGVGFGLWANTTAANVDLATTSGANGVGATLTAPTNLGIRSTTHRYYVSPTLSTQLDYTFGVNDLTSLRGLSDYYYDSSDPPPALLPQMSLIYVNATGMTGSTVTFSGDGTGTTPSLTGGGVLVVEGNVVIDGTTNAQTWDGLIFATGDYTQLNSSTITGGVINGKHAKIHAQSGKPASLLFSRSVLERAFRRASNYKEQHATIVPGSDLLQN